MSPRPAQPTILLNAPASGRETPGVRPNTRAAAFQGRRTHVRGTSRFQTSTSEHALVDVQRPPLIGLTTYPRNASGAFDLPGEYVEGVRRAGGVPVLIPPGEPRPSEVFELLDGLVLTGGGDIDPSRYGGGDHETIYMVDHERDASELDLARRVVEAGMPALCI